MSDFLEQTQKAIIQLFSQHFGEEPSAVEILHSAGSNRVYLRLCHANGKSFVGAFGSNRPENDAFIYLSHHFLSKGLPVPQIYAVSEDHLCYLQADLGDLSLHQFLAEWKEKGYESSDSTTLALEGYALLRTTLRLLANVQIKGGAELEQHRLLPPQSFDLRSIMFDLNYFKYCFLKPSGLPFDEIALEDDFETLANDLLRCDCFGSTFLYRDFQARNIMVRHGQPWLIDFQSGRRGPLHYDVASFLWQASAQYPASLRQTLIEDYLDELSTLIEVDRSQFKTELQLFVLFRMLQVLGAYGLRGLYERKPYFLQSIPLALRQISLLLKQSVVDNYPTLSNTLLQLASLPEFQPNTL